MSKQTKPKDTTPEEYNIWGCITCNKMDGISHAEMMEHLKTIHGIDTKTAKGSKRMLMHSDSAKFYTYKYEWEIGGVRLLNELLEHRSPESAMYWE
jgi:hypothetical protein